MSSAIRFFLPSLLVLPLLSPASAAPAKKPAAKPTARKPTARKPAPRTPTAKPAPRKPVTRRPGAAGSSAPASLSGAPEAPEVAAPAPVAEVGPRTFALLVGVGKYLSPLVSSLTFPAKDASALRGAFVDANLGAIPPEHVLLLTDEAATREAILGAADTFFKPKMREGDRLVVFLAGHGIAKGVGLAARSWFLPHDVKGFTTAQLEASGVEMKALADKLSELPASQFALFVDACREDPTPGRGIKSNALSDVMTRSIQITPENRSVDAVTLFACSVGQRAYEDPALKHGVFTHAILQGLRDPTLPKAEGFVDAAVLARYVEQQVGRWAKKVSQEQDADIEQTPEMVAGELKQGVRVLRIKGAASQNYDGPLLPSRLGVLSVPDRARVFIDGRPIGLAPLVRNFDAGSLPADGMVKLRVEAAGQLPVERDIKLLPGYSQQVEVDLIGARGIRAPGSTSTLGMMGSVEDPLLKKARQAEEKGDSIMAESAYEMMLEANSKNVLAYERLAQLRSRHGDFGGAINALSQMNRYVPGAHALSLISRAYTSMAMRVAWKEAAQGQKPPHNKIPLQRWSVPQPTWTSWQCAVYGFSAAEEALKADSKSTEALTARGLALVAGDISAATPSAADRAEAKRNIARALLLEESDADANFAMGLATRVFAVQMPEDQRKPEMDKAREWLSKAIELRPDFYEARREMALCAALSGDSAGALREGERAISYRGDAVDAEEIAAMEMAMSAWHKQAAETEANPEKKAAHQAASEGYIQDSDENSDGKSKLAVAAILSVMGIGDDGLWKYLPAGLLPAQATRLLNGYRDPKAAAQDALEQKKNDAKNRVRNRLERVLGR